MKKKKYTKGFIAGKALPTSTKEIEGIASNEVKDRVGEILRADGWDLGAFKGGGPLLWSHLARELPIGRVTKAWVEGKQLKFKAIFDEENTLAKEIQRMVSKGFIDRISVGFRPLEFDDEFNTIKQELLEISLVNVPANDTARVTNEFKEFEANIKSFEEEAEQKLEREKSEEENEEEEEEQQQQENTEEEKQESENENDEEKQNDDEKDNSEKNIIPQETREQMQAARDALDLALKQSNSSSPDAHPKAGAYSPDAIRAFKLIIKVAQVFLTAAKKRGGEKG